MDMGDHFYRTYMNSFINQSSNDVNENSWRYPSINLVQLAVTLYGGGPFASPAGEPPQLGSYARLPIDVLSLE